MDFFRDHLLSIITYTPLLGAALLMLPPFKRSDDAVRWVANLFGFAGFLVSLPLWFWFQRGAEGFQFVERHPWIPSIGVQYLFGVDGISTLLILLTTLLGFIAILSSWTAITVRVRQYYIFLLLLQVGMLGVFCALDMFLFYVFWEVMLVPMYFLIGIWGGERRLYAAIKFFLYTLVGSVGLLLGLIKLYFLTQDASLVSTIAPATKSLIAGNGPALALLNSSFAAAQGAGTGTFNIMFMQSLGSVLPMGTMQGILFFACALGFAIK